MKRASAEPKTEAYILVVSEILVIYETVPWWLLVDLPNISAIIDCFET